MLLLFCVSPMIGTAAAQEVVLQHADAIVWARQQVVEGTVNGSAATDGALYAGDDTLAFSVVDGAFSVPVRLSEDVTPLAACIDGGAAGGQICSDTLRYELGFVPRPEAELRAEVDGRQVTLHGSVVVNPDSNALTYAWTQDDDNPTSVALDVTTDSTAGFSLPESAPDGEYYFDWTIADADGDAFRARTFVTVSDSGVVAFDLMRQHAAWVNDAIIYEIAPRLFSDYKRGRLEHITARIPELIDLGINTIWLQPIYPYDSAPQPTQMYDVTGYFEIWEELGTKEDLRTLVETAHANGLKVMLDFVANHSSIKHPYAQNAIAHGPRSHYYDFYMREGDGAPYSSNYHTLHEGEMTFIYYFWDNLMTWDYANPEVERFIIEASRYWIEAFDIDGYRFDAVWGPHARDPDFTQRWRRALKRVKPEILMLAEAKAPYSEAYVGTGHPDNFESFDVAYDWTDSDDCISQWAFARRCLYSAYYDETETIFNSGVEGLRARDLRNALTNYGDGFPEDAKILRFLENNDLPRMSMNHSVDQTQMAAALMFALDGIPMLYYGQALGTPYQYPSYPPNDPLTRYGRDDMWAYYQHLIRLRTTFPAFTTDHFAEIGVGPSGVTGHVYAFRRWSDEQNVFAAVNMADEDVTVEFKMPVEEMDLGSASTYYLTDLFSGDSQELAAGEMEAVDVEMSAFSTRLWILADSTVAVPTLSETPDRVPPDELALGRAYPNPFQSRTTIGFETPQPGPVRVNVYDVLGRHVTTLVDHSVPAGRHEVSFDGTGLSGGMYVYRLEHDGRVRSGTMVLLR